jgi:hypothetical protein
MQNQNYNYNNNYNNIITIVINYIYATASLFKYKLLETTQDLELLKKAKYNIAPNYNGINSLLVFITIDNTYYAFLVDRRSLSHNKNNIDIANLKLIQVYLHLNNNSLYLGSVFEGVYIYNNKKKIFIINDVYSLRSQNIINENHKYKLININSFLKTSYSANNNANSLELLVNNVFELSNIKTLINNYIVNSKFKTYIKGLTFVPENQYDLKLIYLYSNGQEIQQEAKVQTKLLDCRDNNNNNNNKEKEKEKLKTTQVNLNNDNDKILTFRIKKTDTVDVYNLYLSEIITNQDLSKKCKYKKVGIAFIPNIECSHFCNKLFSEDLEETILVDCKYNDELKKWSPFKIATNKKLPDELKTLDN